MTMTELISGDENARNVARAHTRTHAHTHSVSCRIMAYTKMNIVKRQKSGSFITTGAEPATIETLRVSRDKSVCGVS
jgi:hypothetical protein